MTLYGNPAINTMTRAQLNEHRARIAAANRGARAYMRTSPYLNLNVATRKIALHRRKQYIYNHYFYRSMAVRQARAASRRRRLAASIGGIPTKCASICYRDSYGNGASGGVSGSS